MSGATKLMTAGGGGVALTPASSIASDVTVNVPSQNCTLGIQGPAFRATLSTTQNISTGTRTKVALNSKTFDSASAYDNTTNYRFQPLVAGYYQVNGIIGLNGTAMSATTAEIRKNGAAYSTTYFYAVAPTNLYVGDLVYLNGSTDYIELWGQVNASSGAQFTSDSIFSASLVRAA